MGETHQHYTETAATEATRKQIRGSSLLLAGKLLSVGLNLAAQVLIVRYLAKSDYGAWAYALAVIAFFQSFCTLGLKRSITRFVPIYHEKEEYEKLFGTIALMLITIFLSGLVIISAVYVSPDLIARLLSGDGQPALILFIMIFLVPVEAVDGALLGLFASFSSSRAIFFRKHVVAPTLKLMVAALFILLGSSVYFLACGYLLASVAGVITYIWVFIRLLRREGMLQRFKFRTLSIPAKEIFLFSIPLLTSDVLAVLMHSVDTFMLGYFHGSEEVASYQVILPAARLNKMVMTSFAFLYTPLLARLFAKDDYTEINALYWRTAIWLSVLSFPFFALTFSLAKPLTIFLYGTRYEQSWIFLQLISLAYYFNVSLGFNSRTLTVLGKVRYIMAINFWVAIANVGGNLLLIPRYGALGAAIATMGSMILLQLLKQVGLRFAAGIRIFDRQYLLVYLFIAFSGVALLLVQYYSSLSIHILLPLSIFVSLVVFKVSQDKLRIEETFPELLKLPMMRSILRLNNSAR